VPAQTSDTPVELSVAIGHDLPPGPLTVVGLFSDEALSVRQVEQALAGGGEAGLEALGGQLWIERVEVLP
jgi:hypothetical protein